MKTAVIFQPYFFPYIGYYQLAKFADVWVIFDETQYIDKGWIARNRILHSDESKNWTFINIPLRKPSYKIISDIQIDHSRNFRKTIFGKLSHYKKISSHYKTEIKTVDRILSFDTQSLSLYLAYSLNVMFSYLEINTEVILQSKSSLSINRHSKLKAGTWALEICKELNCTRYVNPVSGTSLFDCSTYHQNNIDIRFMKSRLQPYSQRRTGHIPGLSIIDALLLHGKQYVVNELKSGYLVE